jgi:hypothetical protein
LTIELIPCRNKTMSCIAALSYYLSFRYHLVLI